MLLTLLTLLPLAAGALVLGLRHERLSRAALPAVALVHMGLTVLAVLHRPAPAWGGWLQADPLGLVFLLLVSLVFLATSAYNLGALGPVGGAAAHRLPSWVFSGCLLLFLGAMSLTTVSYHLGLLWVAIEATTLASTPLVLYHRSPSALEAAWKYLLVGSVGIALALMGLLLLAAATAGMTGPASLDLDVLLRNGAALDRNWVRAAFIFLVVGYGTKVGLAPMHTWLPDAHSEAPSGVSALLSGVLVNCALIGLLRGLQVCQAAGEGAFAQGLLRLFGLVSLAVAALFLTLPRNYKRMLAYSTVEHMGIVSLALGLGPAGVFPALLHAFYHSLTKSGLFLVSGNILAACGTKDIAACRGLWHRHAVPALLWSAGGLAILGSPPFGLFFTEFAILGAALRGGNAVAAVLLLLLLTVVFCGMGRVFLEMSCGPSTAAAESSGSTVAEPRWMAVPGAVLLAGSLGLGLYLPAPLMEALRGGAALLGGMP